ncbi:hypothetical protein D3C80_1548470 [compost metagenome]
MEDCLFDTVHRQAQINAGVVGRQVNAHGVVRTERSVLVANEIPLVHPFQHFHGKVWIVGLQGKERFIGLGLDLHPQLAFKGEAAGGADE